MPFEIQTRDPASVTVHCCRIDDASPPPAGWATQNPELALAYLYVAQRDGPVMDELVALISAENAALRLISTERTNPCHA